MARVVDPFLALSVKYLDIIDPRYYQGSILDYINEKQPDLVISIMGMNTDCERLITP